MNSQPIVSVIIPTYNRPILFQRALKSVLNQTYQNFEIIVIDDSTDNKTAQIVNSINDHRIKYIHNKIKTSLPAARNLGVKNSNPESKYVAFLDDDDMWLPQFLEKTIKKLETKEDIVGVIPYFQHISHDGYNLGVSSEIRECWNTFIGNGSVLRKDLFIKENIWFDEKLTQYKEDWDFGLRVLKNHKLESIQEVLQIYFHHSYSDRSFSTMPVQLDLVDYFFQKHIF